MAPIKTVLIGLGNIGALYDLESDCRAKPLTHLKAITQNSDFEIVAMVDPDASKRSLVQEKTGLAQYLFFGDVKDLNLDQVDVVVFAAPPEYRVSSLSFLMSLAPEVIIFEKPLAKDLSQAKEIEDLCAGKTAVVNFHRRYDTDHQKFFELLPQKPPAKIIFHYTKGIWNYGSHGVDLLTNWFGSTADIIAARVVCEQEDPLIDAIIRLVNGTDVHFCAHKGQYDQFEFEIFYDDSKYNLRDGGILKTKQNVMHDVYHRGYSNLEREHEILAPSKVYGLENLYTNVSEHCKNECIPIKGCSVREAIEGLEVIESIIRKAKYNE